MHEVVLVAPAAFKGTMGPRQVAEALSAGARRAMPGASVLQCPISDGGDGLLEAVWPPGSLREHLSVTGLWGEPVSGELGWIEPETAIFESATACGIALLRPDQLDPLRATTRGVGEMVWEAVERGARTVVVGLGGSLRWMAVRARRGGWVGRCVTRPGPPFPRVGARWPSSRCSTGAGRSRHGWSRWRTS